MVVKLDDPRGAYARVTAAPVTRSVIEQTLAARTTALDSRRLGLEAAPAPGPAVGTGSVPYVMAWPPAHDSTPPAARMVPDVRGLDLRTAAHALHEHGFEARVKGWGTVSGTTPAAGSRAEPGTVGTVRAAGGGGAAGTANEPGGVPGARSGGSW